MKLKTQLRFRLKLLLNLVKVQEISNDFHEGEDSHADGEVGDTGVHVLI